MCSGFLVLPFPEACRMLTGWQGTGAPRQVESQCPCWGNSIKVLEARMGGCPDALLGLRKGQAELGPYSSTKV